MDADWSAIRWHDHRPPHHHHIPFTHRPPTTTIDPHYPPHHHADWCLRSDVLADSRRQDIKFPCPYPACDKQFGRPSHLKKHLCEYRLQAWYRLTRSENP